jgi:glutamate-cysteine ligase
VPDRFGTTPSYTVGVEEEFQLVAPSTLQLAPAVEEVSGAIPDGSKRLARELFQDCVEMRSSVFSTVAELARELPALRRMVAEAANKAGVGIGLPRSRHKVCPRGPHGGLSSRVPLPFRGWDAGRWKNRGHEAPAPVGSFRRDTRSRTPQVPARRAHPGRVRDVVAWRRWHRQGSEAVPYAS